MRGWVKVFVIMILLPILIGGIVLLIAGRPLAFHACKPPWADESLMP